MEGESGDAQRQLAGEQARQQARDGEQGEPAGAPPIPTAEAGCVSIVVHGSVHVRLSL